MGESENIVIEARESVTFWEHAVQEAELESAVWHENNRGNDGWGAIRMRYEFEEAALQEKIDYSREHYLESLAQLKKLLAG